MSGFYEIFRIIFNFIFVFLFFFFNLKLSMRVFKNLLMTFLRFLSVLKNKLT